MALLLNFMKLSIRTERWPLVQTFHITGKVFSAFDVLVVQVSDGEHVGQGEGLGVYYLGDTIEGLLAQAESVRSLIEAGLDREHLLKALPAGGARNAIDCALWDLEAKAKRRRVWDLAGVEVATAETQYSMSIEPTVEATAVSASKAVGFRYLKLKLDAREPVERVRAVRAVRPDARLVVDANQAWTFEQLQSFVPAMADLGVHMIEQPLPRGQDASLEGYRSAVPLCADESCLHQGELETAAKRYQMINIKLDKVGGLTAGLQLARAAHDRGLQVMVGCMGGTSLSMAPAFVLACQCEIVDLDGPLWQRDDRLPGISYHAGVMPVFGPAVWG